MVVEKKINYYGFVLPLPVGFVTLISTLVGGALADVSGKKYPEQVSYLKENFGFSQAHANALVMYSRGSKSSKKFDKPIDFFKKLDSQQAKTVKKIFKVIQAKNPKLELVIAWNQPMLKLGNDYIFGATVATKHILIAPWSTDVLEAFSERLKHLDVKKKTIGVPNDWKVEEKLILDMVKARIAETK